MPDAALAFRYVRRRTRVATDATGHLEWLCECLEPHFAAQTTNASDWNITFSLDPQRYSSLSAQQRASSNETVALFTLDSRLVRLPRWNGGVNGDLVVFDEEFDVFYTVSKARLEIGVLARTLRPCAVRLETTTPHKRLAFLPCERAHRLRALVRSPYRAMRAPRTTRAHTTRAAPAGCGSAPSRRGRNRAAAAPA